MWPFRRQRRPGGPDRPAPPGPPVTAPSDWLRLSPVQRVVSGPPLTFKPGGFRSDLAGPRNPPLAGSLGHHVSERAPAGVVRGLATVPGPPYPSWQRPAELALLQRQRAAEPTVHPEL